MVKTNEFKKSGQNPSLIWNNNETKANNVCPTTYLCVSIIRQVLLCKGNAEFKKNLRITDVLWKLCMLCLT